MRDNDAMKHDLKLTLTLLLLTFLAAAVVPPALGQHGGAEDHAIGPPHGVDEQVPVVTQRTGLLPLDEARLAASTQADVVIAQEDDLGPDVARRLQAVEELAEAAIALSREQGFVLWMALATALRGWARAEQGQREEGIVGMRWGLDEYRALSQYITRPHLLTLLAEAYGRAGQAAEGLTLLAEALAVAERGEVRDYEAELHRLRGDLLLSHGKPTAEVETHYRRALKIARRQEARSLELRAAMSLCRLWQAQGKRTAARALLAETYGWFTEGFTTADLQDARALLEQLS